MAHTSSQMLGGWASALAAAGGAGDRAAAIPIPDTVATHPFSFSAWGKPFSLGFDGIAPASRDLLSPPARRCGSECRLLGLKRRLAGGKQVDDYTGGDSGLNSRRDASPASAEFGVSHQGLRSGLNH